MVIKKKSLRLLSLIPCLLYTDLKLYKLSNHSNYNLYSGKWIVNGRRQSEIRTMTIMFASVESFFQQPRYSQLHNEFMTILIQSISKFTFLRSIWSSRENLKSINSTKEGIRESHKMKKFLFSFFVLLYPHTISVQIKLFFREQTYNSGKTNSLILSKTVNEFSMQPWVIKIPVNMYFTN